jgi:GNAT superfamily N-acetyltransferase
VEEGISLEICEITKPIKKSALCNKILRALPQWFGIEEAIVDYTRWVRPLPVFAAYEDGDAIGFVALKEHNAYTAEIMVMGVLPEYHRRGIGGALVRACEQSCRARKIEYLTVKTLDESHPDEFYARTRRFYLARGFRPLEVFPLYWDKANPCLLMGKYIGGPHVL